MKFSVVATLYHSEPHLEEFWRRTSAVARQLAGDDYQIVLVNDGSPDNSGEIAIRLSESDPHVLVVDLSRNFGHHKAMMTGLAHATGDLVFLIDSDLEEEPEWLLPFSARMAAEKCDVVYGVQQKRRGPAFDRWSGRIFYRSFRLLTRLELPDNVVVARLMTRRYVDALLRHDEREVFIAGLWVLTGFAQSPHEITKHSTSVSTYTMRRKVAQFVDAVASFSSAPLIGIFFLGCIISFFAAIYIAFIMVNWLTHANPPSGWTSVIASVWLLGGLIIAFIGVIGVYLSKIFSETKRRPYTIVRQIHGQGAQGGRK